MTTTTSRHHPQMPPLLSPSELQKFEGPLIALANMSGGDLRKLFYAFFSFLNRRTDFYCILPEGGGAVGAGGGGGKNMGFKEGQAEQILLASFRQFPLRRVGPSPPPTTTATSHASVSSAKKTSPAAASSSMASAAKPASSPSSAEKKESEGTPSKNDLIESEPKKSTEKTSPNQNPEPAINDNNNNNETTSNKHNSNNNSTDTIRYTDDGKQIPIGNGGSTTRYVWTQTLEEVTVHIPLPENNNNGGGSSIRAKDLDVKIAASTLSIKLKNNNNDNNNNNGNSTATYQMEPIEGTFFGKVRPSESTWTLETTSNNNTNNTKITTLQLVLEKVQKTWWATILTGDPIIDTSLVDSTRKIDTYDEKTQGQIRRIMFDQRQERLGLPKSDEIMRGRGMGVGSGGGDGGGLMIPPPPPSSMSTVPDLPGSIGGGAGAGGLDVQEVARGKVENLPEGVEFIDGETLDRASISKK